MAASDDFPRGWELSNSFAGPSVTSIAINGVFGIVRVLTAVNLSMYDTVAAGPITIEVVDTTASSLLATLGWSELTAGGVDLFNWVGKIVCPAGHQLTIEHASALPTGANSILEIQGYDA